MRMILIALVAMVSLTAVATGCGSSDERGETRSVEARAAREAAEAVRIEEEQEVEGQEASECDPNYSGACLDPYASDYDCEGGSGDGPEYTGTVAVVGEDHYGLDANSNGVGCEPE